MFRLPIICDLIDKADNTYYRLGHKSIMTDAEYDSIKQELKNLDPDNPRLTRVGLPYSVAEIRNKVKHNIPMGSLDNTDDGILGFEPWYDSVSKQLATENMSIAASLKIDGASICATYVEGQLVRVATRGNGEVGEDITVNGANFKNLPTVLPSPLTIDVRGEAILEKADFIYICERDSIQEEDRSNPRNVGNGILGRDDGADSNLINFIAFNIEGVDVKTEFEKYETLRQLGFKHVPFVICESKDRFHRYYSDVIAKRDQLPFEIDGIVVVLNDIKYQCKFITKDIKSRLRPKYARAVKFPHKSNTTTLLDVELSVGHTRTIVPTAILKEVRVGGVNVSRALLNNWDEIERLQIAIGDDVEVILAGDIIPKIIRKVKEGDKRIEIKEPTKCPACGSTTTRNFRAILGVGKKGANTFCVNEKCVAGAIGKIDHWIGTSKTGVGILGIGDIILRAFWDYNLVKDPADLYNLTVEQIEEIRLEGDVRIGKSRAETIIANINEKRILPLHIFLGSLGIDLLGRRRAKILIEKSGGRLVKLENWLNLELLGTIDIDGFGSVIRSTIIDGLAECKPLIEKLLLVGVEIEGEKMSENAERSTITQTKDKPFAGYSFCLTGTRAYIKEIEERGGEIKSGVSKGLTYLVQADPLSVSGKTKKAEEYGVNIISLEFLKQVIEGKEVLEPL